MRRLCFSLGIQELVPAVPRSSLCPAPAPYTPVAARPGHQAPGGLIPEMWTASGFDGTYGYRRVFEGLLPLGFRTPTCPRSIPGLLIRRSPPRLLTAAARTGLRPAPESRSRWAYHHLLRSFAPRFSVQFIAELLSVPLRHTSTSPQASSLASLRLMSPMRWAVHGEGPILAGRAQGDRLAAQGLADAQRSVLETDEAVAVDLANLVAGRILDRRQNLGERPRARSVALPRRRHAERRVRPLVIVAWAPVIEGALAVGEIAEAAPADHFGLEGPMEALLLALGLGMMRPAVQHPDAEPHQPDAEAGQRLAARIAPGRTVVHQHGQRQAIAAEGFFQMAAHRLALLVPAGRQHQRL